MGGRQRAERRFVEEAGPRLGRALAALYGFEDGRDATAEALAYAWENWQKLQHITNLTGYLFRAAALYRAAALIPGVTLVRHAKDAIGRNGVAVARLGPGVDGGVREELIFSRSTSRLIGERTVIARTGEVTGATAIIDRAFVDHRGQVPRADKASSWSESGTSGGS